MTDSTSGVIPDENTPAGTKLRNIHTEIIGSLTSYHKGSNPAYDSVGWDAFGKESFGHPASFRIYDPAYYDDDK